MFANGEITGNPTYEPGRPGGDRWPYVYPCRIDIWVPFVKDAPATKDSAPKNAIGRIQRGAAYAPLKSEEYHRILARGARGVPHGLPQASERLGSRGRVDGR